MTARNVGLARALSKLGYCSRSKAAEIIRAGRVHLNGKIHRDPETPVRMGTDRIEVDGRGVCAAEFHYLMLNKPRGVVTSADDEKGRQTVYDLLPAGTPWVAPVGRLDKGSEGLLLLTNDSEWAARITAPESHLPKRYHVQVRCTAPEDVAGRLRQGMESEGEFLGVREVNVVRHGRVHAWLEVVLEEGRNRHIRRMLEQIGIECVRLLRVSIGPLDLGDLPKGSVRPLDREEKAELDRALNEWKSGRGNRRQFEREPATS